MQVPTLYSATFKIWFEKCIFLFYSNSAVFIIIIKIVKQKFSWGFQKQTVGKQKVKMLSEAMWEGERVMYLPKSYLVRWTIP